MQIPSYFALILRAFSVIEGIALRVDPGYSIVQECFPYIARRLLTDNHPRTRAALQQLLYAVRPFTCLQPAGTPLAALLCPQQRPSLFPEHHSRNCITAGTASLSRQYKLLLSDVYSSQ